MRIERTGPADRLKPRLERFFVEALGGTSLDHILHAEARKADFSCLRGLLVIELKSLEEDGSERMNNIVDELRERADWPVFYGSAPMEAFLKHISEPEDVKRRLVDRIGRAIKNHLSKANKQLAAHKLAFPRHNSIGLVILVNEDHELYTPEMVGYIIQRLLLRRENDAPLYPEIDAVVFLTERHAALVDRQIAFPVLCIEGASTEAAPWKREVMEILLSRWAKWNNAPYYNLDQRTARFATIDRVPDQMKRHEKWQLNYKRNPYMRGYTLEQLRERFDEAMCVSSLAFVKGAPLKPSEKAMTWSMSTMSHLMIEMASRAVPVTQLGYDPLRSADAARRLNFPEQVIAWFKADLRRK